MNEMSISEKMEKQKFIEPVKMNIKFSFDLIKTKLTRFTDNHFSEEVIIFRNNNDILSKNYFQLTQNIDIKNVIIIDFSSNSFDEIPKQILQFIPSLQVLVLSKNNIQRVPNELFAWFPNLEHLNFSHNMLTEIPETAVFEQNFKLTYLDLTYNMLTKLPSNLKYIKTLQNLLVDYNNLTSLPVTLAANPQLSCIQIYWMNYLGLPFATNKFTYTSPVSIQQLFDLMAREEQMGQSEVTLISFIQNFLMLQNYSPSLTDLEQAALSNDKGALRSFILHDPLLLSQVNENGLNIFIFSVLNEKYKSLDALIQLGANINCRGDAFGSALHIAVNSLNVKMINFLIKNGADINITDINGNNCLHILFKNYNKAVPETFTIAKILFESKINVNHKNDAGISAIHTMIMRGSSSGLNFCIQQNKNFINDSLPTFNLFDETYEGNTLLHLGSNPPNVQILIQLTQHKLNPFNENNCTKTCLELISPDFMTSRKVLQKYEKNYVLKKYYSFSKKNNSLDSQISTSLHHRHHTYTFGQNVSTISDQNIQKSINNIKTLPFLNKNQIKNKFAEENGSINTYQHQNFIDYNLTSPGIAASKYVEPNKEKQIFNNVYDTTKLRHMNTNPKK